MVKLNMETADNTHMNWIVGDVHGMALSLDALIKECEKNDPESHFWFVGDYCDRGPDSRGVVDRILALGARAHCCRGNHDDMFDLVLSGVINTWTDGQIAVSEDPRSQTLLWFINFGMGDTLASYGFGVKDLQEALMSEDKLAETMKGVPQSHRDFYHNLPLFLESDDFFVVHAYLPPDAPDCQSVMSHPAQQRGMLWQRYSMEQIRREKRWTKVGYVGHTPTPEYGTKEIVAGNKLTLVDTGGVFDDGGLSAICHETGVIVNANQYGKARTIGNAIASGHE